MLIDLAIVLGTFLRGVLLTHLVLLLYNLAAGHLLTGLAAPCFGLLGGIIAPLASSFLVV